MNVVAVPIIESNTELQGTRHSSMTARNVGGTTDRNSLSTRQANGAAMLVEVDAAAVAVLLLVRLIAEGPRAAAPNAQGGLLSVRLSCRLAQARTGETRSSPWGASASRRLKCLTSVY